MRLPLILALCMVTLTAGCQSGSPEDARAYWQQRIERLDTTQATLGQHVTTLQTTLDEMAASLADLPDDDSLAIKIRTEAQKASEHMGWLLDRQREVAAQVEAARLKLASLPAGATAEEINAQMTGQAVTSLGTVLPPPWNIVAVGIGTTIAASGGLLGFIGRRKAQKAEERAAESDYILVQSVAAIENAKRFNENLKAGFHEAAPIIHTGYGPAVTARINEIRQSIGAKG